MNANEIRQKFLDFQVRRGHKVIAPAPLVLEGDPTTLSIPSWQKTPRRDKIMRLSAFDEITRY